MALNTYLHLKLNNSPVTGGVTQKGREGTILVTSLDWSFDSDGNIAEVKFTSELDREIIAMSNGLKTAADAEGLFDFYEPSIQGVETKIYTLEGRSGKITSINVWMLNNKDPNLDQYPVQIQTTMTFDTIEQNWLNPASGVVIP